MFLLLRENHCEPRGWRKWWARGGDCPITLPNCVPPGGGGGVESTSAGRGKKRRQGGRRAEAPDYLASWTSLPLPKVLGAKPRSRLPSPRKGYTPVQIGLDGHRPPTKNGTPRAHTPRRMNSPQKVVRYGYTRYYCYGTRVFFHFYFSLFLRVLSTAGPVHQCTPPLLPVLSPTHPHHKQENGYFDEDTRKKATKQTD